MPFTERLVEVIPRDRQRLRPHGRRLHVPVERIGLLEDVLRGLLAVRLGLCELAARLMTEALRLELFCSGFGEGVHGLASDITLVLAVGVFQEHMLGTALSNACHLLRVGCRPRVHQVPARAERRPRCPTRLAALATT